MDEAIDKLIAALSGRHGGHITRVELQALGLTQRQIDHRIRTGWLIRVFPGVYAVGHVPRLPVDRAHAALLAVGLTAILSHGSAATLWGYSKRWTQPFELTTTGDRRPGGVCVHRSRTLGRRDITAQLGIRTTSPARTLLDISPRLSDKQLRRAFDDGLHSRCLCHEDVRELLARLPHAPRARRIRKLVGRGHNPTRSELEGLFLDLCEDYGLPRPQINVVIAGVEVDAYFPDAGVIVELDSLEFHADPLTFESDRRRDRHHLRLGMPTVRLTWEGITSDPAGEAAALKEILSRRRPAA